jgi:hypothetical protein
MSIHKRCADNEPGHVHECFRRRRTEASAAGLAACAQPVSAAELPPKERDTGQHAGADGN